MLKPFLFASSIFLMVVLFIQFFGPINFNDGSAVVTVALPWQKIKPLPMHLSDINLPSTPSRNTVVVRSAPLNAPQDLARNVQTARPDPVRAPRPKVDYSAVARSGATNRCYDLAKRLTVFTDAACESLGLVHKGVVSVDTANHADPVVRPQVREVVQVVQVVSQQEPQSVPKTAYLNPKPDSCDYLESIKNYWSSINTDYGRRQYAEALYQFNVKCR